MFFFPFFKIKGVGVPQDVSFPDDQSWSQLLWKHSLPRHNVPKGGARNKATAVGLIIS